MLLQKLLGLVNSSLSFTSLLLVPLLFTAIIYQLSTSPPTQFNINEPNILKLTSISFEIKLLSVKSVSSMFPPRLNMLTSSPRVSQRSSLLIFVPVFAFYLTTLRLREPVSKYPFAELY